MHAPNPSPATPPPPGVICSGRLCTTGSEASQGLRGSTCTASDATSQPALGAGALHLCCRQRDRRTGKQANVCAPVHQKLLGQRATRAGAGAGVGRGRGRRARRRDAYGAAKPRPGLSKGRQARREAPEAPPRRRRQHGHTGRCLGALTRRGGALGHSLAVPCPRSTDVEIMMSNDVVVSFMTKVQHTAAVAAASWQQPAGGRLAPGRWQAADSGEPLFCAAPAVANGCRRAGRCTALRLPRRLPMSSSPAPCSLACAPAPARRCTALQPRARQPPSLLKPPRVRVNDRGGYTSASGEGQCKPGGIVGNDSGWARGAASGMAA